MEAWVIERRQRDESFDSAEAFGERAELDLIEEATRGVERSEIEGEHGAGAALLLAREFVVRVRRETRVVDLFHLWMRVEMARDGDAVGVVLQHADGERLDSARNEEAIHRRESGARGALDEINFLGVFGAREDDRAAGGVAVTVEIFRHRVDDDVSSKFNRPLEIRAEEGVVDDERDVAAVDCNLGHRGDVGDAHGGIGGRFDVQHLRVRAKRGEHSFGRRGVHKAEFEAEVHEQLR